jgi:hypothetical protein
MVEAGAEFFKGSAGNNEGIRGAIGALAEGM